MIIERITPRFILDSRGYPTVEVELAIQGGGMGRASVPSGASTGKNEACELRDGGVRFGGKGVDTAVENIRRITSDITARPYTTQREFDEMLIALDGTAQKTHIGANAILALSLAFAKATARSKHMRLYEYIRSEYEWVKDMSLPMPLINVLNGGKHSAESTDIQEWMIVPVGARTWKDALEMSTMVFYELRKFMEKEKFTTAVGDEGGFPLHHAKKNIEALDILQKTITKAGLLPGTDIAFAIDAASSEFCDNDIYTLRADTQKLSRDEMIEWLKNVRSEYPVVSIEDGLQEEDFEGWNKLTEALGPTTQLVGDDLFCTNKNLLQKGIDMHAGNAILIKPNQIGTLTETADTIILAHKNGYKTIISHRSGETEDTTIAHLAVASGAGQIKTGSLSRTERLCKYNELLRISERVHTFENPFA